MAVRVAEEACKQSVSGPGTCRCWDDDESQEPWEDPDVSKRRDDGSFLDSLRHPGDDEKVDSEQELRGNSQEIGLEDTVADVPQDERQVSVWRGRRDVCRESDKVKWPLLPVFDCKPQPFRADCLSTKNILEHGAVAES